MDTDQDYNCFSFSPTVLPSSFAIPWGNSRGFRRRIIRFILLLKMFVPSYCRQDLFCLFRYLDYLWSFIVYHDFKSNPLGFKKNQNKQGGKLFLFTLFSVFLLKYCTYYIKKNNMYKIQLCKMENENDILEFLLRFIGYHDFKSIPLGFKKNQNKQGG